MAQHHWPLDSVVKRRFQNCKPGIYSLMSTSSLYHKFLAYFWLKFMWAGRFKPILGIV